MTKFDAKLISKVKMYSKDPCPYCVAALRFLKEEKGVDVDIVDLTGQPEEMIRIKEVTGWRTFPIILINDKVVGGYTDIKTLDEEGELDSLLGLG